MKVQNIFEDTKNASIGDLFIVGDIEFVVSKKEGAKISLHPTSRPSHDESRDINISHF